MGCVSREIAMRSITRILLVAGATFALIGLPPSAAAQPEAPGALEASKARVIDEGMFVDINGVPQWITVRGRDRDNPVLLWLHGGPGIAMSSQAPLFFDWEKDFTIVQWDQPGGGATLAKNGVANSGELTIERYTRDAIAVAEWARRHLGNRKIVIMGTSWGTLLGLQLVARRPDLVAAYVGTGQFVSGPRGSRYSYETALKAARERRDAPAISELEGIGPPPHLRFEDFLVRQKYLNPPVLAPSPSEAQAMAAVGELLAAPAPADAHYIPHDLPPVDGLEAFMSTQRAIFAETSAFDADALGSHFAVPMFFFQGADDLNTPTALVREYYEQIEAPVKRLVILPDTGHFTVARHTELLALLNQHVRPLVTEAERSRPL